MKVILLNGPSKSGKDTAANILSKTYTNIFRASLADPIYAMVKEECRIDDITWAKLCTQEMKDIPQDVFNGQSLRQTLINISENIVKPEFGQDVWARRLIYNLKSHPGHYIPVVTDCGFDVEIEAFVKEFGRKNIYVVRLFRHGFTFENDSRKYVDVGHDVTQFSVYNNTTLDRFKESLCNVARYVMDD